MSAWKPGPPASSGLPACSPSQIERQTNGSGCCCWLHPPVPKGPKSEPPAPPFIRLTGTLTLLETPAQPCHRRRTRARGRGTHTRRPAAAAAARRDRRLLSRLVSPVVSSAQRRRHSATVAPSVAGLALLVTVRYQAFVSSKHAVVSGRDGRFNQWEGGIACWKRPSEWPGHGDATFFAWVAGPVQSVRFHVLCTCAWAVPPRRICLTNLSRTSRCSRPRQGGETPRRGTAPSQVVNWPHSESMELETRE